MWQMLVESLTQEYYLLGAFSPPCLYAVFFGGGGGSAGSTFHRTGILVKLSKSEFCKSSHFSNTIINYFIMMKDYVY